MRRVRWLALRCDRGAAMPLAILVAGLLLTMAAQSFETARQSVATRDTTAELVRAGAIADAAIHRAIAALSDDAWSWQASRDPKPWTFDGAEIAITISNEAARLSLNTAPEPLLEAGFVAAGMTAGEASRLAGAIDAFRLEQRREIEERDGPSRLSMPDDDGADELEGLPVRAFKTLAELRRLDDVDLETYRMIRPLLTIHGEQELPDELLADERILNAMETLAQDEGFALPDSEIEFGFVPDEDDGGLYDDAGETVLWSQLGANFGFPRYFRVVADVRLQSGVRSIAIAVIGLSPESVEILEWRQAVPASEVETS